MSPYNQKNVFVSGGAGVIGVALVKCLLDAGAKVFVGDLKPKPKEFPSEVIYRQGDLNDIKKEELLDFKPAYIFHLAASFERSEETFGFWEENERDNLLLSHHLIDILRGSKNLERFVFASSYLIYDSLQYLFKTPQENFFSLSEKSAICPRNLCGAAKLFHEEELKFIQRFNEGKLWISSARIFRSYGRHSRDVISRWIRSLLKKEEISVYNKEGAFDFIFADDVAEGLFRLGALKAKGVVNLGTGRARRISEVLEILKKYFPEMRVKEKSASFPFEASEANMERFKSLVNWVPPHQLEESIPLLIEYEARK